MKLSRHARNNIRLYKILETDIIETINAPDLNDREGDKLIAIKKFTDKYSGYPLKVVYKRVKGEEIVITSYPLKKNHWR